jgi:NAD+ diphosphatase
MIHEISPHRFNNQYIHYPVAGEDDLIFHFKGNALLLKNCGDDFELPRKRDFPEVSEFAEFLFLFSLDDVPCFLVMDDLQSYNPECTLKEIQFFRSTGKRELAWAMLAGFHLMNWYMQNKFCGKCGAENKHKPEERAIYCPDCSATVYPKISPAIIVAILSTNKILLARNANFPGGWYSLVAGYADIGESLEDALVREVKEEVGLDVWNIRYYKSQPWPLSGSMMIGFIAEADEKQQVVIDKIEITDAAWFTRDNLPNHPSTISIAGEMIEKFKNGEL